VTFGELKKRGVWAKHSVNLSLQEIDRIRRGLSVDT
jgi:hypothetical protein